ncbi:hypothetical protein CYMTET_9839, partial [Cymbomonas tetramitiformis]
MWERLVQQKLAVKALFTDAKYVNYAAKQDWCDLSEEMSDLERTRKEHRRCAPSLLGLAGILPRHTVFATMPGARTFSVLTRAAWAKVLLPAKAAASSAGVGSLISPCVFTKAPLQPAAFSTITTKLPQCSGFAASQLMSSTARVVQAEGPTLALKAQVSGIQRATSSSARRYCTQQAPKPAAEGGAIGWVQMLAGLGVFLAADKALKMGAAEAGISFPAPLIGMFGILTTLTGLSAAGMQGSSDAIIATF